MVLAVIAVLLTLLLPTLRNALDAARRAACLSNQRQIAAGLLLHAADHDGYFPLNRTAAPFAMTRRSGWHGWSDIRPALRPYISHAIVFYCPAGALTPTAPHRSNYQTYAADLGPGGWDKLAGWDAIPDDVPANFYVMSDYSIFPGFVLGGATERMRMLLDPDADIEDVPNYGVSRPMIPDRVGSPTPYGPARTPMTADMTYVDQPFSLVEIRNGLKMIWIHPHAFRYRCTQMKAHIDENEFDGLGVSWMDGHAEWRGPDVAGPRLGLPETMDRYGYVSWY